MSLMQEKIEAKLIEMFSPVRLKVVNESAHHRGHAGDDGSGESHFSVCIEAECFDGESRVARQRLIYDALKDEMKIIHALSITVYNKN